MHQADGLVNQNTLKSAVTLHGVGLHTGAEVTMTMKPANPGYGIRFQRIDLPEKPVVKADVDFVVDTSRGTTIEHNGARVSTVEHTMAALVGMGIDNALIELDGPEVPILDGSALQFIEAIESAGIQAQDARRVVYSIDTNIHYYDPVKNVDMLAVPATDYQITTLIDFNSPVLGTQHAALGHISEFRSEIGPCRTFWFL
ncbi:MAG: UDP-3-O-acyl-N-acetylglucosamine deacetylase, partial [Taibaiella sp.]|nr:UDP-3-O-acyl-N-acetylglucosamine deacetylase [Taibaiella sp.]